MTTKVRKQISLEPIQAAQLKQMAESSGLSEAELIRRALDIYFARLSRQLDRLSVWEKEKVCPGFDRTGAG